MKEIGTEAERAAYRAGSFDAYVVVGRDDLAAQVLRKAIAEGDTWSAKHGAGAIAELQIGNASPKNLPKTPGEGDQEPAK